MIHSLIRRELQAKSGLLSLCPKWIAAVFWRAQQQQISFLAKHRRELRIIKSQGLSAKAIKQMSPSENCCFKRSTAQWCRDGVCRFAETNATSLFIISQIGCWTCTKAAQISAGVGGGVGGAFSPSTLKGIQLKKTEVHIVPTTVCSGCHVPLPTNQEKLMCCTLSHLHPVPRHSSHHSSILYLVDLCRSPFFF